ADCVPGTGTPGAPAILAGTHAICVLDCRRPSSLDLRRAGMPVRQQLCELRTGRAASWVAHRVLRRGHVARRPPPRLLPPDRLRELVRLPPPSILDILTID